MVAKRIPNPEPQFSYARFEPDGVTLVQYWDPYPQYILPNELDDFLDDPEFQDALEDALGDLGYLPGGGGGGGIDGSALYAHIGSTVNVHGIPDTAELVTEADIDIPNPVILFENGLT